MVAEDTDLLVLLLDKVTDSCQNVYMISKQSKKAKGTIWHIQQAQSKLQPDILTNILFIHAFTGCDTTSGIKGIGKSSLMKKINQKNKELLEYVSVFNDMNASKEQVTGAGEIIFLHLYGGKNVKSLNQLRFQRFSEKISSALTEVDASTLPPTKDSADYHSLRVFLQVCMWKNCGTDLLPERWGWKMIDNEYVPVTMDNPPAPDYLLKIIKCNCQKDCSSRSCSCRKYQLPCNIACGSCKGVACTNTSPIEFTSDEGGSQNEKYDGDDV